MLTPLSQDFCPFFFLLELFRYYSLTNSLPLYTNSLFHSWLIILILGRDSIVRLNVVIAPLRSKMLVSVLGPIVVVFL